MSRSGYSDDCDDQWALIRWRGAVASSIRGKRGQKLLTELLAALEAMPVKRLIADEFVAHGEYCTLGVLAAARGLDAQSMEPEAYRENAKLLDVAEPLVQEITYMNDEAYLSQESAEQRWDRMRAWVEDQITTKATKP